MGERKRRRMRAGKREREISRRVGEGQWKSGKESKKGRVEERWTVGEGGWEK